MVLGEGRGAIHGDRSTVKHMRAAKVHHGGHDEAVFEQNSQSDESNRRRGRIFARDMLPNQTSAINTSCISWCINEWSL